MLQRVIYLSIYVSEKTQLWCQQSGRSQSGAGRLGEATVGSLGHCLLICFLICAPEMYVCSLCENPKRDNPILSVLFCTYVILYLKHHLKSANELETLKNEYICGIP